MMITKMFDRLPGRRGTRRGSGLVLTGLLCLTVSSAGATTKGLNQIVTPDVQPAGQLSVSYQQQDPYIGNPSQLQFEMGLTKRFEIAYFQGLVPGQETLNTEYGIIQRLPFLLSAGFSNFVLRGAIPWPYLEGGYYTGKHKLMAGITRVGNQTEGILGYGYQAHPRLLVQLDYQSGPGNSSTAGFTYSITPALSLNPAVYVANDRPHHLHGYAVLTWNVQLFKGW